MISLEKLFDHNDVSKDPKVQPIKNDIEDQNIGTKYVARIVKLSKNLSLNYNDMKLPTLYEK